MASSLASCLFTVASLALAAVSCCSALSYCSSAWLNCEVRLLIFACTWSMDGCGSAPADCVTAVVSPIAASTATLTRAARRREPDIRAASPARNVTFMLPHRALAPGQILARLLSLRRGGGWLLAIVIIA